MHHRPDFKLQTKMEVICSNHYLFCCYRFSDKTIETIKADVKRFMYDREKDDSYFKFMDWKRKENEIVVLTMYAYDDIELPKKLDIAFQIGNPEKFVHLDFTITQGIFNFLAPLNYLSRGHKHVCVIEFDKDIPDIFNQLPLFEKEVRLSDQIQLGLCNKNEFENIKISLNQLNS